MKVFWQHKWLLLWNWGVMGWIAVLIWASLFSHQVKLFESRGDFSSWCQALSRWQSQPRNSRLAKRKPKDKCQKGIPESISIMQKLSVRSRFLKWMAQSNSKNQKTMAKHRFNNIFQKQFSKLLWKLNLKVNIDGTKYTENKFQT